MGSDALIYDLQKILAPEEIIQPSSPLYASESQPWAAQKDLKPRVVARPKTVDTLSKLIAYLSAASPPLDINIRSQGYGSSSARDVLVSMAAFDEFHWDSENKIVTLGAGQRWGDYYKTMRKVAPEYSVVACRTPMIGVGGSVLHGGFSWLGAELGMASDVKNMLDAQVVKPDGTVVWASTEPDLLWALRGGSGSFGVVTSFKFRAYPYSQKIYAGPILVPRNALSQFAKSAAKFAEESRDPKVGMFLYVMRKELLQMIGAQDDMLVVHAYDAHGQEHAHGEKGFKWALDIPGVIESAVETDLAGVADLQSQFEHIKGLSNSYFSPLAVAGLSEETIVRAFEWYFDAAKSEGTVGDCCYLLFELMQNSSFGSKPEDRATCGWPRPTGARHIILLGTGCHPDAPAEENKLARKLIITAFDQILKGDYSDTNFVPNTIEDFHDKEKLYGEHYAKLRELKSKWDPNNLLKGHIMNGDVKVATE